MRVLLQLLWLAGFVQLAIASANFFLPAKLNYKENLSKVSPIIRQIFVVHSVYIVGVVLLFAAVTFSFSAELASGYGLGRFLAAAIAVFWLFRAPVQLLITTPRCARKTAGAMPRSLLPRSSWPPLTAQPRLRTDCESPL